MQYYDGTKLLSLLDLNGKKPDIYISTSNRSAGKTTFFSRYFVNRFIKHGEMFGLFYRYNYELSDVADKFFSEIKTLFFPSYTMTSKPKAKGIYHELLLNGELCGYAISINSAEQIKKYSHLFATIQRILYDEFLSENNKYCNNEVTKFQSCLTSISRGGGQQVRRVPVYLLGNFTSLLNPYYIAFDISSRLNIQTNYMRGNGWVLEQSFYEEVAAAQKESGIMRALSESRYTKFATEKIYLNDNDVFIERPQGKSRYLATIIIDGKNFALREYTESGIIYCDTSVDQTFPRRLAFSASEMDVNYIMLRQNSFFIENMRSFFEYGCFRFKDLECKKAVFKMLSY